MKKDFYRNRFERKHYAIFDGQFYYENGCSWTWNGKEAKIGTKREMDILLNGELYQMFLRGAKVVDVNKCKILTAKEWNDKIKEEIKK